MAEVGGLYCFVRPDSAQLAELVALVDGGAVHVEVQEALPLERAADALALVEQGHVRGKLVLTV